MKEFLIRLMFLKSFKCCALEIQTLLEAMAGGETPGEMASLKL